MPTHEYKQGNNSTHGENLILLYYDRAGIKAATAKNIYGQFADRKEMPKKNGKTYAIGRWVRSYDRDLTSPEFLKNGFISSRNIADVTTGLTSRELAEGATTGYMINLKKINIQAQLHRYGEMIEYTDEVDLFSNDEVQVRYREELGESANQQFEDLIQRDMLSTNNVLYAGVGTSLATMGQGLTANGADDDRYRVSYDFIRKCTQKLVKNRASKNTEMVTGSVKIDTKTINEAFYAIIGPEVLWDLETRTYGTGAAETFAYTPAYKYADASKLAEGEVGRMGDARFILSETAMVYKGAGADVPANYTGTLSNDGTKFDVFPILFPTKGAFATVGLKGEGKIKFFAQEPSKIDHANPFGTRGFFTSNWWYAGLILKEEALLKGLVLASA